MSFLYRSSYQTDLSMSFLCCSVVLNYSSNYICMLTYKHINLFPGLFDTEILSMNILFYIIHPVSKLFIIYFPLDFSLCDSVSNLFEYFISFPLVEDSFFYICHSILDLITEFRQVSIIFTISNNFINGRLEEVSQSLSHSDLEVKHSDLIHML